MCTADCSTAALQHCSCRINAECISVSRGGRTGICQFLLALVRSSLALGSSHLALDSREELDSVLQLVTQGSRSAGHLISATSLQAGGGSSSSSSSGVIVKLKHATTERRRDGRCRG